MKLIMTMMRTTKTPRPGSSGSGCGAAFAELRGDLTENEAREYRRRLEGRRVDDLRPRDPAEARVKLRAIVDQAVARLEARHEVHQQWEAAAAANQVDRLAFDASPEGERLRRFQLAGNRSLLRTLETLLKIRREGDDPQPDPAATDIEQSARGGRAPGEPSPPPRTADPAETGSAGLRPRRDGRPRSPWLPGRVPTRLGRSLALSSPPSTRLDPRKTALPASHRFSPASSRPAG